MARWPDLMVGLGDRGHERRRSAGGLDGWTAARGSYLESVEEIPEPREFVARVHIGVDEYSVVFEEHEHTHGKAERDNNCVPQSVT